MKLKNDQHELFCQEYLIDLNGTKAAKRAKYSEKTARIQASQLLSKLNIQQRIGELQAARAQRLEISQDRVWKELACLGHSNIKKFIAHSAKGYMQFKDLDEISEEDAKAIEAIKVNYDKNTIEFKLHSKTKTLEMIGRHLGMFMDKFDVCDNLKTVLETIFTDKRPKE